MGKKQIIFDDGCHRYDISNHTGKIAITYAPEDIAFVKKIEAELDEKKYVYIPNPILSRGNLPHDGYIDDIGARLNECICMIIVLSKNLIPDVNKEKETEDCMPYPKDEKTADYIDKRSKLNRFWYRIGQISARNAAIIEKSNKENKDKNEPYDSPVFLPIWAETEDGKQIPGSERPNLADTPLKNVNVESGDEKESGLTKLMNDINKRFKDKLLTNDMCLFKNASACIPPSVIFGNLSFHFEITERNYKRAKKIINEKGTVVSDAKIDEMLQYSLKIDYKLIGLVEENPEEFKKICEYKKCADEMSKVSYFPSAEKKRFLRKKPHGILYCSILVPVNAKYGIEFNPFIQSSNYSIDKSNKNSHLTPAVLKTLLFGGNAAAENRFKVREENNCLWFVTNPERVSEKNENAERLFPQ